MVFKYKTTSKNIHFETAVTFSMYTVTTFYEIDRIKALHDNEKHNVNDARPYCEEPSYMKDTYFVHVPVALLDGKNSRSPFPEISRQI